MDQIKVAGALENDFSNQSQEREAAPVIGSEEARPRVDWALLASAGGDGIAIW